MWNIISLIPVLFSMRDGAVSSRRCSHQRLLQIHFYSWGCGVKLFFFSASSCIFSICSIFLPTKDHYRSVESDITVTNFEHFLCGEHLVPKKAKCYFSDGCRRMSRFNPPVRDAYFLNFMATQRRWMLPGSHSIAVASALPELALIF